jgi:drug/metabolite transporter (DMT)-like permease
MSAAAIGWALAAAVCIALAASLQHHAATGQHSYRSGAHLLGRLARNPRWTLGFLISAVGLGFHAAALHAGPLATVQPILVSSLVFALPLRALLDRQRVSRRDLIAAAVVAGSLAAFLLAAHPSTGHAAPNTTIALTAITIGAVICAGCSAIATRTTRERLAGFTLGLATGILYGLVGGALKATVHTAGQGIPTLLSTWPLWALIVTGVWGLVVNQRAYTRAPLTVSLPVMTVMDPVIAVIFGAYVYAELPADNPAAVTVQVAALASLAAAVTALAHFVQPDVTSGKREQHLRVEAGQTPVDLAEKS